MKSLRAVKVFRRDRIQKEDISEDLGIFAVNARIIQQQSFNFNLPTIYFLASDERTVFYKYRTYQSYHYLTRSNLR